MRGVSHLAQPFLNNKSYENNYRNNYRTIKRDNGCSLPPFFFFLFFLHLLGIKPRNYRRSLDSSPIIPSSVGGFRLCRHHETAREARSRRIGGEKHVSASDNSRERFPEVFITRGERRVFFATSRCPWSRRRCSAAWRRTLTNRRSPLEDRRFLSPGLFIPDKPDNGLRQNSAIRHSPPSAL